MSLANQLSEVITTILQTYKVSNDELTSDQFFDALRTAAIDSFVDVFPGDDAEKFETLISPRSDENNTEHSPKAPKKLVRGYIDGCFDIMHSGHYNALRQAKSLCDVLVVGVHSDAEIMRNKGPPVMHEEERLAAAKACKWADEVVFDTPYDPNIALLDRLNCDFGVHGDDMPSNPDGTQAYADLREAGRLRIIKRTEGVSTTDLVGRLLLMTKEHHNPLIPVRPHLASAPDDGSFSSVLTDFSIREEKIEAESSATGTSMSVTCTTSIPSGSSVQSSGVSISGTRASRVSSVDESRLHLANGLTGFLPTTWRIVQFSNLRKPKASDRVVYIDGAFDLFHVGHIKALEKARALGTFLYVGIHDDATVNAYKGRNFPIMNLHERVLNVLSCKFVDEVVIGAPLHVTQDLLTVLGVSVVTSSSNTRAVTSTRAVDPYVVPKEKGIFTELDVNGELDTDAVISRIIDNRIAFEKRNETRVKKEMTYLESRPILEEV